MRKPVLFSTGFGFQDIIDQLRTVMQEISARLSARHTASA
jgi:hypothetical protein